MAAHSDYAQELVTRVAPRWAWNVIDSALVTAEMLDADSREQTVAAGRAMDDASEHLED